MFARNVYSEHKQLIMHINALTYICLRWAGSNTNWISFKCEIRQLLTEHEKRQLRNVIDVISTEIKLHS